MKSVYFNPDALEVESKIMNDIGIPSSVLMENAGINATDIILNISEKSHIENFIILCGKGNNAGDGFVIARHLINIGCSVNLTLLYDPDFLKGDASLNFKLLLNLYPEIRINNYFSIHDTLPEFENSIIIDSIFGIGFKGYPDEHISALISTVNSVQEKIVVAIDTPSCLEKYDSQIEIIKSDVTITMGSYKFETLFDNGKKNSGEIYLADIGTGFEVFNNYNSRNIFLTEENDIIDYLSPRDSLSNKYTTGKVLVIAGSEGYTGAAELSSLAAMRMGSGALIIAFPKDVQKIIESKLTEPVKLAIDYTSNKDLEHLIEKINWADSILIGPGCGISEYTEKVLKLVFENSQVPVVIDGDALSFISEDMLRNTNAKVVITPHVGEFAKILKISSEEVRKNFYQLSNDFAKNNNIVVTLKSATTICTDGNKFLINSTGSENLATFGSGDVLSGIIASILSRNKNILEATSSGCFIHGKCGDELLNKFGNSSMIASDLISILPEIKSRFLL